jgi:hypothetical protein
MKTEYGIHSTNETEESCLDCENFIIQDTTQNGEKINFYELACDEPYSITCEYFSFNIEVKSDGKYLNVSCKGAKIPVVRTIPLVEDDFLTKSLIKIRERMIVVMKDKLHRNLEKTFSGRREWELEKKGEGNAEEVVSPVIYIPLKFNTKMTSHSIVLAMDLREGKFIHQMKMQDEKDSKKYEDSSLESSIIEIVTSIHAFFRDARFGTH